MAFLKLSTVPTGRSTNVADFRITPTPGRGSISMAIVAMLGIDQNDAKPSIQLFFNDEATGLENSWFITKGFGEDAIAISPNKDEKGRIASYGFNSANIWNRIIQYYGADKNTVILDTMSRLELANANLIMDDNAGGNYSAVCTAVASVVRATEELDGESIEATIETEGRSIPVFAIKNFMFDEHTKRTPKAKAEAKAEVLAETPVDKPVDEEESELDQIN